MKIEVSLSDLEDLISALRFLEYKGSINASEENLLKRLLVIKENINPPVKNPNDSVLKFRRIKNKEDLK